MNIIDVLIVLVLVAAGLGFVGRFIHSAHHKAARRAHYRDVHRPR